MSSSLRKVVLLFSSLMLVVGSVFAQAEQQQLQSLLTLIEAKEGLQFSYESATIAGVEVPAFAKTWAALQPQLRQLGLQARRVDGSTILLAPISARFMDEGEVKWLALSDGREPLVGALVLAENQRSYVTNALGLAQIQPSPQPQVVELRYLGYKTRRFRVLPGSDTTLILLVPDTLTAKPALVIAPLPSRALPTLARSARAMHAGAYAPLRLPNSALDDLGFSGTAGLNAFDGESAIPGIRGSQGSETRVELDGLPLYHVEHLFGLFAAINPQTVEQIDVYRSHYPADRGGVRGGLLDLRSPSQAESGAEVSLSQVAGAATLRANKGCAHLLLSGRSSFGDVAGSQAFEQATTAETTSTALTSSGVPDFRFYDGYARLEVAPKDSPWHLALNGFRSRDVYSYEATQEQVFGTPRRPASLLGRYGEESQWRNEGLGVQLRYQGGPLAYTLSLHRSSYERTLTTSTDYTFINRRQENNRELANNSLDNRLVDQQIGLQIKPTDEKDRWEAGAQLQQYNTRAFFRINQFTPLNRDNTEELIHGFGSYQWGDAQTTQLVTSLRGSYAVQADRGWLSPRLIATQGLALSAPGSTKLRLGYSYTRQVVQSLNHENQFGQTYEVLTLTVPRQEGIAEAHNFSLGLTHQRKNFYAQAEAYFRELPGVLATFSTSVGLGEQEVINPQPTFLSASGTGQVLGLDVDVRLLRGAWEGTLAYTLARSRARYAAIAGNAWQRAPDDRRHRLATSHRVRLGRVELGGNYEAASGLVYNDIEALDSQRNRRTLSPEALQTTLEAYHRVDLFGSYTFPLQGAILNTGVRLYNAFDRLNVTQRQYVLGLGQLEGRGRALAVGTEVGLLGRLLLFEVGLEF